MNMRVRIMTAFTIVCAVGAFLTPAPARSDYPVPMAPPIDISRTSFEKTANSVFSYREVPQHQRVALTRATFDQAGYRLYDTDGETIIVPFDNDNLYVMKFARSHDGEMYFINDDGTPELFVPEGRYLTNAAVPSAKWYPFSATFHPDDPVFLGVAPSWHDYVAMGWYPDMYCYGGYYCDSPWYFGAAILPCAGFEICIGSNRFFGWGSYNHWGYGHPDGFSYSGRGDFGGFGGRGFGGQGGGHVFRGIGSSGFGSGGSTDFGSGFLRSGSGGRHEFRGVSPRSAGSLGSRGFGSFSDNHSAFRGGGFSDGGGHRR